MRYLTPVLFAIAATVLSTAPAHADLGDQLFKLLPDDGAMDEEFAHAIAIDNGIVVIGKRLNDFGHNSGSAYLFDASTGVQLFKLVPNDLEAFDLFGWSVAIGNGIVAVGAVFDDARGSAYLFDASTGAQLAKLLPSDRALFDDFGSSIAIDNGVVAVGASQDDDNGNCSGSAYLFDASTGLQLFKLLPDDGAANDFFGNAIAIHNGVVAVAAARDDNDTGPDSGAVYLFDASTGLQLFKLLPDDGAADDVFGQSVAIDNGVVAVGAVFDQDNGPSSGSAYLFDASTGAQIAKFLTSDGAQVDLFGWSIAIDNGMVVVGANNDNNDNGANAGSAYLFDISDANNPAQIAKLLPNDGARDDRFGWSIAIHNDVVAVGAIGDDDNGNNSGSAYLFDAGAPGMCPWDLDASGDIDVKDLLMLLGAWGPCPKKGACLADFDNSGDVGVKDLLFLLGAWGPCP